MDEKKSISVYWKRTTAIEGIPKISAFKKEGETRDYLGTPVKGGQKYMIPDIEENRELIETMGGSWSKVSPDEKEKK